MRVPKLETRKSKLAGSGTATPDGAGTGKSACATGRRALLGAIQSLLGGAILLLGFAFPAFPQAINVSTPIHTGQFSRTKPLQTWQCSSQSVGLANQVEFLDSHGAVAGYVDCNGAIHGAGTGGWPVSTHVHVLTGGGWEEIDSGGKLTCASGSTCTGMGQLPIENTALGENSLLAVNPGGGGIQNTAVGFQALRFDTTGGENTAVGFQALNNNLLASFNVAVGDQTLAFDLTGQENVAVGHLAMQLGTNPSSSTAVGAGALSTNTAFANTAVGTGALNQVTSGDSNTAQGWGAGGGIITGRLNTFVGYNAAASADVTNSFAIGSDTVVAASNTGVIGDNGVTDVYFGSITPSATIHVAGCVGCGPTSAALPDLSNLTNPTAINLTTLTFAAAGGLTSTTGDITQTPASGNEFAPTRVATEQFCTTTNCVNPFPVPLSNVSAFDATANYRTAYWNAPASNHWGSGIINQGAAFDGTDILSTVKLPRLTTDFTYAGWVKTSTDGRGIFDASGTVNALVVITVGLTNFGTTAHKAGCLVRTDPGSTYIGSSTTSIDDGSWHLVALVRDTANTSVYLYIDGALETTIPAVDVSQMNLNSGFFWGEEANDYFVGTIDETGFWKRALSAAEITQLYNAGVGQQYPFTPSSIDTGIWGYWKFDDLPTFTDISGKSATATALASTPALCSSGRQYSIGIFSSGDADCANLAFSTRQVAGASDTILFTDWAGSVVYTDAAAVAVALPTTLVGSLNFPNFATMLVNATTGASTTVTVTPASAWPFYPNGNASLTTPTLVIAQGQTCFINEDAAGSAWDATCHEAPITAGAGILLTRSAAGLQIGNTANAWSALTDPVGSLTLSMGANSSTFNYTNSAAVYEWLNTQPATNVLSQSSPQLTLGGQGWDGAATKSVSWTILDVIANGPNGASNLQFVPNGTTGRQYVSFPDVSSGLYNTASICGASGTGANPSIVSCGTSAAGAVYCDVASSAGTCQVNTTAASVNSMVLITPNTADGGVLSVTCNPALTFSTAPILASKGAGSFTINMPTVAVNGACFEYMIVN